jgi:hypothetical protein
VCVQFCFILISPSFLSHIVWIVLENVFFQSTTEGPAGAKRPDGLHHQTSERGSGCRVQGLGCRVKGGWHDKTSHHAVHAVCLSRLCMCVRANVRACVRACVLACVLGVD